MDHEYGHDPAGIKSLDTALSILEALGKATQPLSLSELSHACHEAPSKVHRYLTTFVKRNFAVQSHRHGQYALGRNCIHLGLAAMRQIDLFALVENNLQELARETGCHVFLSIWTSAGPVIVRWTYADNPIGVNTLPGHVMPVTRTAAGRVFAAYLSPAQTSALISRESEMQGESADGVASMQNIIKEVRERRYALVHGETDPRLQTIAVPVMDWRENSLLVVGCTLPLKAEEALRNHVQETLLSFSAQHSINPSMNYFAAPETQSGLPKAS
ncbi:MAG: IclR family transcriptional regulator [Proteobacteria bacterium]|nr:IclR family transcriptional regulator [Pseudomonadota bacterium]